MSELNKKAYLIAAAMAILHNGKRYEQGDSIELTEDEAENLSLYVRLNEADSQQGQQAKTSPEVEQTVAEESETETVEAEATEAQAIQEAEAPKETKSRKGKKQ